MRVLITGGSGSVGKAIVDRLARRGFSILVIGRRPDMTIEGAEYQVCDINDYGQLREAIRGCEAVVHLAAIPNPGSSPEKIFQVNAQGTFNVFQAAAEEGIRRVVQASSINAAGQFYGVKPAPLNYLPLDEEHPVLATDSYSFSKNVIESIGDYFWRREGIASLAFRYPWVAPAGQHEKVHSSRARIQALVDRLQSGSPEERRTWFDRAWSGYNAFRARRPFETPGLARALLSDLPEEEKESFMAMGQRVNFFTMLDERDSAQAVEKGLTVNFEGSHALYITDSQNWTGVESRVLAALFYPDAATHKTDLTGSESLVSIEKARRLIGYEPEFSFGPMGLKIEPYQ